MIRRIKGSLIDFILESQIIDAMEIPLLLSSMGQVSSQMITIVGDLEIELKLQREKCNQLQASVLSMKESSESRDLEMSEIRQKLHSLHASCEEFKLKGKETAAWKEKCHDREQELQQCESEKKNLSRKLEDSDCEKMKVIRELHGQVSDLKAKNDILDFHFESEKAKNAKLEKVIADTKEKEVAFIIEAKQSKQAHLQEMENLKNKFEEQFLSTSAKFQNDSWRQKANQMQKENAELKLKISRMEEEFQIESKQMIGTKRIKINK